LVEANENGDRHSVKSNLESENDEAITKLFKFVPKYFSFVQNFKVASKFMSFFHFFIFGAGEFEGANIIVARTVKDDRK